METIQKHTKKNKKETKHRKRSEDDLVRRKWSDEVLFDRIKMYLTTLHTKATCIHGTGIPWSTFNCRLKSYALENGIDLKAIKEYKKKMAKIQKQNALNAKKKEHDHMPSRKRSTTVREHHTPSKKSKKASESDNICTDNILFSVQMPVLDNGQNSELSEQMSCVSDAGQQAAVCQVTDNGALGLQIQPHVNAQSAQLSETNCSVTTQPKDGSLCHVSDKALLNVEANTSFVNEAGERAVLLELDVSEPLKSSHHQYCHPSDSFDEFDDFPPNKYLPNSVTLSQCGPNYVDSELLPVCEFKNTVYPQGQNLCTVDLCMDDKYEDSECSLKLLSKSTEDCLVNDLQSLAYDANNSSTLANSQEIITDICHLDTALEGQAFITILSDHILAPTLPNLQQHPFSDTIERNTHSGDQYSYSQSTNTLQGLKQNPHEITFHTADKEFPNEISTVDTYPVQETSEIDIQLNDATLTNLESFIQNDSAQEDSTVTNLPLQQRNLVALNDRDSSDVPLVNEGKVSGQHTTVNDPQAISKTAVHEPIDILTHFHPSDDEVSPLLAPDALPPMSPSPQMGHGTIFKESSEEEMMLYLQECANLNFPRTQQDFREDLQFYYKWSTRKNLEKKHTRRPVFSKLWFERFKSNNAFKFVSPKQAENTKNKVKTVKDWYENKLAYIRYCNDGQLLQDSSKAFIMECEPLVLSTANPSKAIPVLISYHAQGEIMRPVLVSEDILPIDLQEEYQDKFLFSDTVHGDIQQDTVVRALNEIKRFMLVNTIDSPVVIYLTPRVSQGFGFVLWKLMRMNGMIPQLIPPPMFAWFKSSNRGIFEHLQPVWKYAQEIMETRTGTECSNQTFCHLLGGIWDTFRKKSYLVKTFQQSQMLLAKPKPRKWLVKKNQEECKPMILELDNNHVGGDHDIVQSLGSAALAPTVQHMQHTIQSQVPPTADRPVHSVAPSDSTQQQDTNQINAPTQLTISCNSTTSISTQTQTITSNYSKPTKQDIPSTQVTCYDSSTTADSNACVSSAQQQSSACTHMCISKQKSTKEVGLQTESEDCLKKKKKTTVTDTAKKGSVEVTVEKEGTRTVGCQGHNDFLIKSLKDAVDMTVQYILRKNKSPFVVRVISEGLEFHVDELPASK